MSLHIDRLCQQFLEQWSSGRPELSRFLSSLSQEDRRSAVPRLVEIDVVKRAQAGEKASPQDYRELLSEEELRRLSDIFQPEDRTASTGTNAGGQTWNRGGDSQPQSAERTQIGRYRVTGVLGQGAYGTVYRAFDDGPLAREVAIKVPRTGDKLDRSRTASLLKEARAAASLSHPNIVTVLDCGELDDGGCFVVFEFIEGHHLGREIQQGLSIDRAIELMTPIALAVHYAHQTRNIFHRDLKPANILIARDGRPLVTDFGLAVTDEQQLENRGEIMGTAAYMSPEQTRGEAHLLDGRTDIWSLGVILYEMLTGRLPFTGKSAVELFEQIQNRPPRPLRQINDSIPHDVERICLTCLERDPSNRFATALDLANALQRINDRHREAASAPVVAGSAPTETFHAQPGHGPRVPEKRNVKTRNSRELKRPVAILPILFTVTAPLALVVAAIGHSVFQDQERANPGPIVEVPDGLAEQPVPVEEEPRGEWQPLLQSKPVKIAWVPPENREINGFQHDPEWQSFTVRSPLNAWIFRIGTPNNAPLRIRGQLTMPDWVGGAGIVWALEKDPAAIEDLETCFAVAIERVTLEQPLKISLLRLTIGDEIFDLRKIRRTVPVGQPVEVPVPATDTSIPFEFSASPTSAELTLNNVSYTLPLNSTDQLKSLRPQAGTIGLMGFGSPISFKRVALWTLPTVPDKE